MSRVTNFEFKLRKLVGKWLERWDDSRGRRQSDWELGEAEAGRAVMIYPKEPLTLTCEEWVVFDRIAAEARAEKEKNEQRDRTPDG